MRKVFSTIIALAMALMLMVALSPTAVFAADTGTVSATVTATLVSITVTDGSVAYGTLATGTTKNTAKYDATNNSEGMATPQTQTINNNGTVAVDLNIQTSNAEGGTDWTLHATTPGSNEFTHAYNIASTAYTGDSSISFTKWASIDTYVNDVDTNVATSASRYLELEIGMPTSVTDPIEHTITVTVQAVEAGT